MAHRDNKGGGEEDVACQPCGLKNVWKLERGIEEREMLEQAVIRDLMAGINARGSPKAGGCSGDRVRHHTAT